MKEKLKKVWKKINIFRWLRFKKEAIILFANLKRNEKAYKHLEEYVRFIGFISYVAGMIIFAVIYQLIIGV